MRSGAFCYAGVAQLDRARCSIAVVGSNPTSGLFQAQACLVNNE